MTVEEILAQPRKECGCVEHTNKRQIEMLNQELTARVIAYESALERLYIRSGQFASHTELYGIAKEALRKPY